jgi:hypothetical protein
MSIIKYCTFFSRQNWTNLDNFQTKNINNNIPQAKKQQLKKNHHQIFGSASSRRTPGASEPRGILTESHPASAGLPTFVAG